MRTYDGIGNPRASTGDRLTTWLDFASPRSSVCETSVSGLTKVSRTGSCDAEGGVTRNRNVCVCVGLTTKTMGARSQLGAPSILAWT